MTNLKKIINESVNNAFNNIINGDKLAEKAYVLLSANAQDGFDTNLLRVHPERNEVEFNNGMRILYNIIDKDSDSIEWRLCGKNGNFIDINNENLKDNIEFELLDLLVSTTPAEFRTDSDKPGYEQGEDTRADKAYRNLPDKAEGEHYDDEEGTLLETDEKDGKVSLVKKIADASPKLMKWIKDQLIANNRMGDINSILKELVNDVAYQLEQNGLNVKHPQAINIANDLIAMAMVQAKEEGYKGPLWKTSEENAETANQEKESLIKEYGIDKFVLDYILNMDPSTLEFIKKAYTDPNEKLNTKREILKFASAYAGKRKNRFVNNDELTKNDIEIGKLIYQVFKKTIKKYQPQEGNNTPEENNTSEVNNTPAEVKDETKESQLTPEMIKENFYKIFNKIDGNKLFL